MPAGPGSAIKAKIVVVLQSLITDGVLNSFVQQDINTDVLDIEFPGFPCAVLGASIMEADWEYPQSNRRTYTFQILIVQSLENVNDNTGMEDLRDAIALAFDNNVTLSGTATLGVQAVPSERVTYADKNRRYVLFNVTIKATTLVALTYNF